MLARFPDKPTPSVASVLPTLPRGQYLAQFKWDGWRCCTTVGRPGAADALEFDTRQAKSCPVSDALRADLAAALAAVPPGSILDGEWMARRAGNAEGEERMWFFDVLRLGGEWVNARPAAERFDLLRRYVPPSLIGPWTVHVDYAAFFESSKADPRTEGIVLKHVDSPHTASTRKCVVNPFWLKVKWRDGADGQKLIA